MKKSVILGALVVAVVLSAAVYASANSATYPGAPVAGKQTASGTVNVNATVNPKLMLTIVTTGTAQTVDFGTVDPGVPSGPATVNLSVSSNKAFALSKALTGDAAMGLTTSLIASGANAKTAATPFIDTYNITVPFTTDPGALTATVQYTVTQN